ncbi:MAG: amidohydrolase family protein [Anaerolineales bacterium]|nr:amidohydrolase family protein [Anaerolineales bacterium]
MPPQPPVLPRYGLKGAIVTMDAGLVIADGVVYIDAGTGKIAAVLSADAPPPVGFETAPIVNTRGTIYPGLIELHNHLCYNTLTLWQVPKAWDHRDQWPNHPDYLRLIRGPAQTLGADRADVYLPAIVRYVEAKCLMSGVTATQGLTLRGTNTVAEFRGNVRNVENPGHPDLVGANARIGDVKPGEAGAFLAQLQRETCVLLHLSEGRRGDDHALSRFDRLQLADGSGWAITPALAGIHGAALREAELELMRAGGAALVWSPTSNLLLYGTTADVATARAKGLRIGLGPDWAPSGSKNLLGELKTARLFSQHNGGLFSDEDLVALVTRDAADILGWGAAVGRVKAGQIADLMVIRTRSGDPYARLLKSTEADIGLVVIGGVPRYGRKSLMTRFGAGLEPWKTGGRAQAFSFERATPDNPIVVDLSLRAAQDLLTDGLQRLPELATNAPGGGGGFLGVAGGPGGEATPALWRLDFDDDTDSAFFAGGGAAVKYKDVAVAVALDPLTVVDDPEYLGRFSRQLDHVPDYLRQGLADLY